MTEKTEDFKNWAIPELGEEEQPLQESSLFGKPVTWYNNQHKAVEEVEQEEQPQPLTLDDIEAIRESAYEDGFNEGKQEGYAKGLEQGKLEGIAAGHQEGLTQGLEEGLTEGASKIDAQVEQWKSLLERLHNPLEKLDSNAEYQLVRLATSLAEQITRCEVQISPQIILQALKQAVEALPINEQKLTIKLHPEDLQFVQQAYSQAQCTQRGWDLQAEPALMRGDCQIQTKVSSVDYTFNSRIEQVLKNFFKTNHQLLPAKNNDSTLSNDVPMVQPAIEQDSSNANLDENPTERLAQASAESQTTETANE